MTFRQTAVSAKVRRDAVRAVAQSARENADFEYLRELDAQVRSGDLHKAVLSKLPDFDRQNDLRALQARLSLSRTDIEAVAYVPSAPNAANLHVGEGLKTQQGYDSLSPDLFKISRIKINHDVVLKGVDAAVAYSTKASAFGARAVKDFSASAAADLRALVAVETRKGFFPLRAKRLEEKAEWASTTSRQVLDMISSAQAEAMQFKAHAADAAKSLVDIVDKIAKRAPQGVSGTESATKAHVETQMTAFETVAKATKAGVDYVDIQGKPRKTPKIGSVRKHP